MINNSLVTIFDEADVVLNCSSVSPLQASSFLSDSVFSLEYQDNILNNLINILFEKNTLLNIENNSVFNSPLNLDITNSYDINYNLNDNVSANNEKIKKELNNITFFLISFNIFYILIFVLLTFLLIIISNIYLWIYLWAANIIKNCTIIQKKCSGLIKGIREWYKDINNQDWEEILDRILQLLAKWLNKSVEEVIEILNTLQIVGPFIFLAFLVFSMVLGLTKIISSLYKIYYMNPKSISSLEVKSLMLKQLMALGGFLDSIMRLVLKLSFMLLALDEPIKKDFSRLLKDVFKILKKINFWVLQKHYEGIEELRPNYDEILIFLNDLDDFMEWSEYEFIETFRENVFKKPMFRIIKFNTERFIEDFIKYIESRFIKENYGEFFHRFIYNPIFSQRALYFSAQRSYNRTFKIAYFFYINFFSKKLYLSNYNLHNLARANFQTSRGLYYLTIFSLILAIPGTYIYHQWWLKKK